MKEAFTDKLGLSPINAELLDTINEILERYAAQGYRLTLRQLFYALVTENIIENSKAEYQKLSKILTKGRMAGIVDWSMIEDRGRQVYVPYYAFDPADALGDIIGSYRLNRQRDQANYVEVWCEKDALSQILKRVTTYFHVPLMINKGYSSSSAMYEAARRINNKIEYGADTATVIYVGDHDPSGRDMKRDITARFEDFNCYPNVDMVALTYEQIERYNPPENKLKKDDFGKLKDPRGKAYFEEFGNRSWEVDALRPEVLDKLIRAKIEENIDMNQFKEVLGQEAADIKKLKDFAETL
jgi:hypothetical protein